MKCLVSLILILSLLVVGCAQSKVINGVNYKPYGIPNMDDRKSPKVHYEPCWGNIIWGCILCETIVAPVYFFGFSMFNPDSPKECPAQ
jgi:hypothetical protein